MRLRKKRTFFLGRCDANIVEIGNKQSIKWGPKDVTINTIIIAVLSMTSQQFQLLNAIREQYWHKKSNYNALNVILRKRTDAKIVVVMQFDCEFFRQIITLAVYIITKSSLNLSLALHSRWATFCLVQFFCLSVSKDSSRLPAKNRMKNHCKRKMNRLLKVLTRKQHVEKRANSLRVLSILFSLCIPWSKNIYAYFTGYSRIANLNWYVPAAW